MFFVALKLNKNSILFVSLTVPSNNIWQQRSVDLFLPFLLIKGYTRSQIISYTFFELTESNQFKLILLWITAVTFEHLNVWVPMWFNRTVQNVYQLNTIVSLFYQCVLGANSQYIARISLNVLTYLFWFTAWIKINPMYFISIPRIIWL